MANKRVQSAGYGSSNDAYHNAYLDTSDLLASNLRKNLGGKAAIASQTYADETKDLGREESAVLERVGKELTSRAVETLESLREDLTSFFQEMSTNEIASMKIEGMIRKAEDIGYSLGVELPPFDPLSNMSG